jgi:hypothetical protein
MVAGKNYRLPWVGGELSKIALSQLIPPVEMTPDGRTFSIILMVTQIKKKSTPNLRIF